MDWKKLIKNLASSGKTQKEMADYCKTWQGGISAIARGKTKSPSWDIGNTLIRLHRICCPNLPLPEETIREDASSISESST
jgi:transcriptional regulator with XRE-family HTH domain